jgi:DNA replication protein DnaC
MARTLEEVLGRCRRAAESALGNPIPEPRWRMRMMPTPQLLLRRSGDEHAWLQRELAQRVRDLLRESRLLRDEREATLSSLRQDADNYDALLYARDFLRELREGQGQRLPTWWLGLQSDSPGRGKTCILQGLVADVCRMGWRAQYWVEEELHLAVQRAAAGRDAGALPALVEDLKGIDLLALDELGAVEQTRKAVGRLEAILDARMRSRLPVAVATNLDAEGLRASHGERMWSRMVRMTRGLDRWVQLAGPDRRGV